VVRPSRHDCRFENLFEMTLNLFKLIFLTYLALFGHSIPVGSPPAGRVIGVGCIANRAADKGGVLGVQIPGIADWF